MTPLSYLLQRGTAMLMAPLIISHIIIIIMAVQGGLSAEEILSRTRGSMMWASFYGLFVFAAAIHAGIGVQTVLREWTPLGRKASAAIGHSFLAALLLLGARAVYAVVWA
ncbi:MAG: succinate dehydrogenase [Alphaproteobacteria bacterium]